MKFHGKLAIIPAVLAFGAAPALALADTPSHPTGPPASVTTGKPTTPGPKASLPAKAKAYGSYCKAESKKHVSGMKGTPFSQCVTAMAKLATGTTSSARTACKTESKKHVSGEKGTPFSRCVSAAAKLKADQADDDTADSNEDASGTDDGSTSGS
jgi:hypothetical protein